MSPRRRRSASFIVVEIPWHHARSAGALVAASEQCSSRPMTATVLAGAAALTTIHDQRAVTRAGTSLEGSTFRGQPSHCAKRGVKRSPIPVTCLEIGPDLRRDRASRGCRARSGPGWNVEAPTRRARRPHSPSIRSTHDVRPERGALARSDLLHAERLVRSSAEEEGQSAAAPRMPGADRDRAFGGRWAPAPWSGGSAYNTHRQRISPHR